MNTISWHDFEKVELRAGTIVDVKEFPEAKKPAFKVWIDFGEFGIKKSSAQITKNYLKDDLIGMQVICVTNFGPRQVGPFMSEVLVTGFSDENGDIILSATQASVPNGARLQ